MKTKILSLVVIVSIFMWSCDNSKTKERTKVTAKEILGNPDYQAISYGGYRTTSRDAQPTVEQLKEDMKIIHAMGIRILRT